MIHAVLSDNQKIITFVDRRKGRDYRFDVEYLQTLCFNKPIEEKAFVFNEEVNEDPVGGSIHTIKISP